MGTVESVAHSLAVFLDYDNYPIPASEIVALEDRLKLRGRLLVKRAYGDWGNLTAVKQALASAAFDLVELPVDGRGKNRGDIRLVVDAMEIAMTRPHIDTFVIISGDSDFLPLISKLRELNRYVIMIARRDSVSKLITGSCDELILIQGPETNSSRPSASPKSGILSYQDLLHRAIRSLSRKKLEAGYSEVKKEMLVLNAKFDHAKLGYKRFSQFIDAMVASGLVAKSLSTRGFVCLTLPTSKLSAANAVSTAVLPPSEPVSEETAEAATDAAVDRPVERKPGAQAKPAASLVQVPLAEDLLDQIYWAARYRLREHESELCLARLSGGIKKLYPQFSLASLGIARQGGFLKLAQLMELEGWCTIQHGNSPSQYRIRFLPAFLERPVRMAMPEHFEEWKELDNLRYAKIGKTRIASVDSSPPESVPVEVTSKSSRPSADSKRRAKLSVPEVGTVDPWLLF